MQPRRYEFLALWVNGNQRDRNFPSLLLCDESAKAPCYVQPHTNGIIVMLRPKVEDVPIDWFAVAGSSKTTSVTKEVLGTKIMHVVFDRRTCISFRLARKDPQFEGCFGERQTLKS